jgi:hypothetical protein
VQTKAVEKRPSSDNTGPGYLFPKKKNPTIDPFREEDELISNLYLLFISDPF